MSTDFDADLVVDARGPRSSSDPWLAAIGAAPVAEELHESGIVYFSRFYRLTGAAADRPASDTVAVDLGYLKYAVFLGDNDTFSITYAVDAHDDELRRALARPDVFEAATRPLVAAAAVAGRRASPSRSPTCTSWPGCATATGRSSSTARRSCTASSPSATRRCARTRCTAAGARSRSCTRSAWPTRCREHGADLDALAREFAAFTERELVPWFRSAVLQDEQARMQATGEELPPEDPRAFMQAIFRDGLLPALRTSPIVFRAFLRWFNLLEHARRADERSRDRQRGDGRVPEPRRTIPRPSRSAGRPRRVRRASWRESSARHWRMQRIQ